MTDSAPTAPRASGTDYERPSRAGATPDIDYFISRRGASAEVAQEVADVLTEAGYTVIVQDYHIRYGANFVAAMHEALKRCRHFIALLSEDYDDAPFTGAEWTNFYSVASQSSGARRFIALRVEDCRPQGLLAGFVFGDLVGVKDPQERKRRILLAVEGRAAAAPRGARIFESVPPRDLNFIGRDQRLAELHALLMDADQPTAITQAAIHGLGGIGKTALAAEYAHRYADEYDGVWWAPAEQRMLLVASLAALAARLDPRLADEPDQEKAAKAGLRQLGRTSRPYLLIYDNVETPETLRDLVPSVGARVLVTTRWTDWSGRAAEVKIDVLGPDAAIEFLQKRAGRTDRAAAARLAEALGRLPLALDHAGAYCRLTGTTFDDYREKVDARIRRAPKGAAYPASVSATFALAIEKAAAEQPAAETLLSFFAFLAPERIPLGLVSTDIVDEEARAEALMALSAVSLIEHDQLEDGSPAITVHRLVQAAMRAWVTVHRLVQLAMRERVAEHGNTSANVALVTRRLLDAFPAGAVGNPKLWPTCAVLLPHVLALRELALWDDASAASRGDLLQRAGGYLQGVAAYREAEPLLREAVAVGEKTLGRAHPDVANKLNSLAHLLWTTGRYAEGEELYREAIAISEKLLGRDHPDVAIRLNNLARLLNDAGRRAEAEPLIREAIAIGEKALGREHPDIAPWLNNLAIILNETGRDAEAQALYREAIAIGVKTFGRDHPEIARAYNNLARSLRSTGEFAEAEQFARDAIAIQRTLLGRDHPILARTLENLARILLEMGRSNDALIEAQAALAIHEKVLGPHHAWTKDSARTSAECELATSRRQMPGAHDDRSDDDQP
jgi:tetratricopeptide (TPR) repeat protein